MKKLIKCLKKTVSKIKTRKKAAEKIAEGGHPEKASEALKEK